MASTPKTPTIAIGRVLRSLGLNQGEDFRVTGYYVKRERVGTCIAVLTDRAQQVIADNADGIESMAGELGFNFRVSIHRAPGGRTWTSVANYGGRTREGAPAEVEVPAEVATEVEVPAEVATEVEVPAEPRYFVETTYNGFRVVDRNNGSIVTAVGSRYAANDTADRMNRAEVEASAEPIGDLVPEIIPENAPIEDAAAVVTQIMNGTELARITMSAVASLPAGTRVTCEDASEGNWIGTVYRGDDGVVSNPNHANYGRAYVGVVWDYSPEYPHRIPRSRPFVDTLSKI